MIGENWKKIAANTSTNLFVNGAHISLDCTPITDADLFGSNPKVFDTNLIYRISYKTSITKYKTDKPFLINCDLVKGGNIRVKNYEGFLEDSKTNEALAFLLKYTYINSFLFEAAEKNKGMYFVLGFNAEKYYNNVIEKNGNVTNVFNSENTMKINEIMTNEKILNRKQSRGSTEYRRRKKE